ncbi:MAG: hypothetical protein SOW79_08345 [Prevotella sp.]|nr:hypothetical protein [Prevotella sp.]
MKKKLLVLSTLALLSCGCTLISSCTSQADRIKEEEAKIEAEAKAFYYEQLEEWHEIKRLALKTTGVTASVKEERRLSYVKLIQIFPNSERWEDISKSIDKEELYSEYDDFLWEIKKAKGWTDFE